MAAGPEGQHIELGISEMNLFMALGQFGLSYELTGQHLIPIGTVYDPFVCRGLDALIYGLYVGAKMIFAGTPAGVSLSPEGGAHQSTVTPSLGIELPGVTLLRAGLRARGRMGAAGWRSPAAPTASTAPRPTCACRRSRSISRWQNRSTSRVDSGELRRQVLAGGYRLIEWQNDAPDLNPRDCVQIAAAGIMVPEAIEAAKRLHAEGVAANVLVITSAERLFADVRDCPANAIGQVPARRSISVISKH